MSWRDITLPVRSGVTVYPGDPDVRLAPHAAIERGDPANVTRLELGSHTGTHVDAPRHFIAGGTPVDVLAIDALCGPARVLDLTRVVRLIEPADLVAAGLDDGGAAERLLLKTRNSHLLRDLRFREDFVALSPAAARLLVARRIALVGIDYYSVEPFGVERYDVHLALLGAGIAILEGADLLDVEPGEHDLLCLPLRLEGLDGAPARAALRPRFGAGAAAPPRLDRGGSRR